MSTEPREPRAIPWGRRAAGRVVVPPSKSVTHRCFNLALLSGLPVEIERPLWAEDTRLFAEALERLGLGVEATSERVRLTPGASPPGEIEIFCGNAGTMLRFLLASLATRPGRFVLDGVPRLRERPVGPLIAALRTLGAVVEEKGRPGYLPVLVHGGTLRGGETRLDAGESSQYLSALLMAGAAAPAPVTIAVSALTSATYVEVTRASLERFGGRVETVGGRWRVEPRPLRAGRVVVEGDYSAACYPAAAAALTGGEVTLAGLDPASRQGDRGFLDLLAEMGAETAWRGDELAVRGSRRPLRAVTADFSGMPDQVPTLAALAPFAAGTTRIRGAAHLRIKESDRLEAMATELGRLGAPAAVTPDGLEIPGIWADRPPAADTVVVDPRGDHRIAMSFALVGLRRPGVVVASPEVVGKSYPEFWRDLDLLLEG
jgi:3-phosphoshikimate 1-carboxyvinyltransferase